MSTISTQRLIELAEKGNAAARAELARRMAEQVRKAVL